MHCRRQLQYLPTPPEIARRCAVIRANWTPSERQRRRVGVGDGQWQPAWQPPLIDTSLWRLASGPNSSDGAS